MKLLLVFILFHFGGHAQTYGPKALTAHDIIVQQQVNAMKQMGYSPLPVPQPFIVHQLYAKKEEQLKHLREILSEEDHIIQDTSALEKQWLEFNAGKIEDHAPQATGKDSLFEKAYRQISKMLREGKYDFKTAVFLTEKAQNNSLSNSQFETDLKKIARKCRMIALTEPHFKKDSTMVLSWAIMRYMVDTLIYYNNEGKPYKHVNYTYDFEDVFGDKDISKMFVTKLLKKKNGNCHSLPYLYKCIAQILGIGQTAHLAYLPNHVYIRQHFEGKWWNCELTSAEFIDDYQLMASGYVFLPGVQSGIYMTPLDEKQSVSAALMDLAVYYQWKYGYDSFVLKCVQRALEYYPNCIQALQMKANYWNLASRHYMKHAGLTDISQSYTNEEAKFCVLQFENVVKQMNDLGYNPVPRDVYEKWLNDMQREKIKREKQKTGKK